MNKFLPAAEAAAVTAHCRNGQRNTGQKPFADRNANRRMWLRYRRWSKTNDDGACPGAVSACLVPISAVQFRVATVQFSKRAVQSSGEAVQLLGKGAQSW